MGQDAERPSTDQGEDVLEQWFLAESSASNSGHSKPLSTHAVVLLASKLPFASKANRYADRPSSLFGRRYLRALAVVDCVRAWDP